jgi:hypothetical protein
VKGKPQETLDDSGSLATSGAEIIVASERILEHEKTADVMTIDYTSERTSGRHQIVSGQATGPRTELGKGRSSRNALKHGIFSKAILLKEESRAEFELLRTDLWEALQPVGRLEELLVDKLASLSWRYRRFLLAETGEIRRQVLEWSEERNREKDQIADSLRDDVSLIHRIHDSDVLKRCLELLAELREGIKTKGFSQKHDISILEKIYGPAGYSPARLQSEYSVWFDTAQASEEERLREGYAAPEDCKVNVLEEIDAEIRRLKTSHKRRKSSESERADIDLLRRNVPESEWLDRVLRYEASLERAFDRTLSQLERMQRLRLGQPVARLDVSISG